MSKEISLENSEIIYEGFMKKSPPLKSKSIFNIISKRWRKRYFILYRTFARPSKIKMLYYRTKPGSTNVKALGSIDLEEMTKIEADIGEKFDRQFTFSIQTTDDKSNERTFYLCCNTEKVMTDWIQKIADSLDLDCHNKNNRSAGLQSPRNKPKTPLMSLSGSRYQPMNQSAKSLDFPAFPLLMTTSATTAFDSNNSYYNLGQKLSPTSDDLAEPLSLNEDVYKVPNELNNQNSYANLDDETSSNQMPKSASSNECDPQGHLSNTSFTLPIHRYTAKTSAPSHFFTSSNHNYYNNELDNELNRQPRESNTSVYNRLTQLEDQKDDMLNVNSDNLSQLCYPLPTRIRTDGSCSSTSTSSSSSNASSIDNPDSDDPTCYKSDLNFPPAVPQRQLSTTVSNLPPIKPPKSKAATNNSEQNTHIQPILNYIENVCLDLTLNSTLDKDTVSSANDSLTQSDTPSHTASHTSNNNNHILDTQQSILSSSSSNLTNSNNGRCSSTNSEHIDFSTPMHTPYINRHTNTNSINYSHQRTASSFTDNSTIITSNNNNNTNSSLSSLDYKEILIGRTEGLCKLKDRLQNH